MKNITAELTEIDTTARAAFTNTLGATFTDHTGGVTFYAGAIDDAWEPLCHYGLLGAVGGASGIVSYSAEDL